jgi:hypothetical protein
MIRSYIEEVPPPATTPKRAVAAALVAAACACTRVVDVVDRPAIPRDPSRLTLAGQFSFPALGRFPAVIGLPFGGISGLAAMAAGTEIFGISDDNQGSRVYRFRLAGEDTSFRVERVGLIPLEAVLELPETDPESIVVLPSGNLLIASEGRGNIDPRVPPSLVEFDRYGKFIRRLPLPGRYEPNPTGPLVKGVRSNTGLESLTLAPGGRRLYTAVEAALAQDGEPATFERGSPARILEYVRRNDSYGPAREFVYIVEPIDKPPFETRFPINGLVELVALGSGPQLQPHPSVSNRPGRGHRRVVAGFPSGLAGLHAGHETARAGSVRFERAGSGSGAKPRQLRGACVRPHSARWAADARRRERRQLQPHSANMVSAAGDRDRGTSSTNRIERRDHRCEIQASLRY